MIKPLKFSLGLWVVPILQLIYCYRMICNIGNVHNLCYLGRLKYLNVLKNKNHCS